LKAGVTQGDRLAVLYSILQQPLGKQGDGSSALKHKGTGLLEKAGGRFICFNPGGQACCVMFHSESRGTVHLLESRGTVHLLESRGTVHLLESRGNTRGQACCVIFHSATAP